jgi:hypothetical protein
VPLPLPLLAFCLPDQPLSGSVFWRFLDGDPTMLIREPGQDEKSLFHRRPRLDLEGHVAGRFRHAESLDEIAVEEGSDSVN